jgi:hypothetical protein
MVMAEVLLALLSFQAVLCLGRFMDTERWQDAIGFGIYATLAILTKGTGLALALVPPLAVLFSRRFYLLARPFFWYPAVIVLVLCGPLCWLTRHMIQNGWHQGLPSPDFTIAAIQYYSKQLTEITGLGLSLLVVTGFIVKFIQPFRHKETEGKWVAVGTLLLSVWIFHCIVPCGLEARHLIPAVPSLLMFLVAGVAWIANRLPLRQLTTERRMAVLGLIAAMVFAGETFAISKKAWYGFESVAERLLSTPDFQKSVFLVASDPAGEGMFISEVAMREDRPGHIVLRASKVLGMSRWGGNEYEALFSTPDEMLTYLKGVPVGIVIVDFSVSKKHQVKHHHLLKEALEANSECWELLGTYPLTRQGTEYPNALYVYRLVGHENRPVGPIRLDMHHMLNKVLATSEGFADE